MAQSFAQCFQVSQICDTEGYGATSEQRKVVVELLKCPPVFIRFLKQIFFYGNKVFLYSLNVLFSEVLCGVWW
jgi:hypothetical protein